MVGERLAVRVRPLRQLRQRGDVHVADGKSDEQRGQMLGIDPVVSGARKVDIWQQRRDLKHGTEAGEGRMVRWRGVGKGATVAIEPGFEGAAEVDWLASASGNASPANDMPSPEALQASAPGWRAGARSFVGYRAARIKRGRIVYDHKIREKGVGVQIVIDLVIGAAENTYDTAIVVNSDTDLVPAVRYVRGKQKRVEYVGFFARPSLGMAKESSLTVLLLPEDIKRMSILG